MAHDPKKYVGGSIRAMGSASSAKVKVSFAAWLMGRSGQNQTERIISCLDSVSDYFVKSLNADLWQCTDHRQFENIYNSVIADTLFKARNESIHTFFIHAGNLYLHYLKGAVPKQEVPSILGRQARMTVIEAIITILELEEQGMTVKLIYNEIINRGLYAFGAENPERVIEAEIIQACENSPYIARLTKKIFRFERNKDGEKVYFLLGKKYEIGVSIQEALPQRVNFSRPALYNETYPVSCFINGQKIELEKNDWSSLLIAITERFIAENDPSLSSLEKRPLLGDKVFFMPKKTGYWNCEQLSNGKWLYTSYSPEEIILIIVSLCLHCGKYPGDIIIECLPINTHINTALGYANKVERYRPQIQEATIATDVEEKPVGPTSTSVPLVQKVIDPETVITWLVKQPNANGTLYLESVAKQYMRSLRTTPAKLKLPIRLNDSIVFLCHTPKELALYWNMFKSAPNYKQVNHDTSGMFSAALNCYMRYLQHLTKDVSVDELDKIREPFEPKGDSPFGVTLTYSRPDKSEPVAPPKLILDHAIIDQLTNVLSEHFSNGYRLDSPIEMVRFRSFATDDMGCELTLSDEELKVYIAACGTTFEGKVYVVLTETEQRIKELTEAYFADGAQAIFIAEFYAKNENWLFGSNVISEDMLVGILRRQFPKLSFNKTYFGHTNASIFDTLETEILRVWGSDVLLTYDQLTERLPYIPLERIKYALGQNGDFIWDSMETYSHISRIEITEEELKAIRAAAVRECNARGYISITDLPFGKIEERNYELSITAVHNAVYRVCLSNKFDKKGKIITRKGDVFDALTIIKEHCRTVDKCSLDDLLNYEKELTGEVHRWAPMEAGNTILVRIDKDTYIADRYVHFNIDLIDKAIELVVKGDYLPLKAFTTFGAFPDCGQTWTLFLLESYCRRFSRKFRFDTPSVNSRNAGAVIRKSCDMDYTEIMTDAVVNSNVILKDTTVGRYLFDSGYTGRSTTARVNEIIDKAKAIRERRD